MSCEKYRNALSKLESDPPEGHGDHSIAGSIRVWLEESCLGLTEPQSKTHTAAIMGEHRQYLGLTKRKAREEAENVRNGLIDDASRLLKLYEIEVESS